MLGTYYTFPELLIWIPFLTGLVAVFIKNEGTVKAFALFSTIATLVVSIISLCYSNVVAHPEYFAYHNVAYVWLPYIGSSFAVGLDGMSFLLTFLTAFSYPIILLATNKSRFEKPNAFYALLLLTQAGIMGVFVATDALLFYFFWELALIPIYFLCSKWGGERRIQATFKFFVYTFAGSLLMLVGIMYVYLHTPQLSPKSEHSFALKAFYNAVLAPGDYTWLFWLFFVAFAVKIPVFPFHTWQPDVYEQANYPSVMVLSGLMVKMGIFGLLRWVVPVLQIGVEQYGNFVMILAIIGIIYASCIAFVQNDLKRFVAWTSIAHLGLIAASVFTANVSGLQGVMLEMLNHGINVLALWIVVDIVEQKTGIRKMSELGGLAKRSPLLAIFLVAIAMANIALPFTNSFISEFLMFNGLFAYNKWYAVFAIFGIILSAVYMLRMVQKVFYGKEHAGSDEAGMMSLSQKFVLSVLVLSILFLGIFPEPVLQLTKGSVNEILLLLGK